MKSKAVALVLFFGLSLGTSPVAYTKENHSKRYLGFEMSEFKENEREKVTTTKNLKKIELFEIEIMGKTLGIPKEKWRSLWNEGDWYVTTEKTKKQGATYEAPMEIKKSKTFKIKDSAIVITEALVDGNRSYIMAGEFK